MGNLINFIIRLLTFFWFGWIFILGVVFFILRLITLMFILTPWDYASIILSRQVGPLRDVINEAIE